MLLHTLLGLPLLLTLSLTPNKSNPIEKLKMHKTVESTPSADHDVVAMMRRYTAYNHWANQQMAEWLLSLSEEDLNKEIESSFSSIKKTIFHIWNAESGWLQTIQNLEADYSRTKDFIGNKEELMEGWLEASSAFRNHVQTMSQEEILDKRPRSNGEEYTVVVDMIHHCMNHSTYHRGQLITMGRQAGLTNAPRTDFIYYISLPAE